MSRTASPVLDRMRLLAAILVVAIHTAPLSSYCPTLDFWLTRVLARLAVPFFFMITGYFLAKNNWRTVTPFSKKLPPSTCYLLFCIFH